MSALMEVWHAIQAVVTSADYYTLGAAIIIIILAGFFTRNVISATLLGLVAFVLLKALIALTIGGQHDIEAYATGDWRAFVDMKMLVLVAYSVIFGVLIAVVYAVKAAFGR